MVRANRRNGFDLGFGELFSPHPRRGRAGGSTRPLAVEQLEERSCPTVTIGLAAGQDNGPSGTDNYASTTANLTLQGTDSSPSPVLGIFIFMSVNGQDPTYLGSAPVVSGNWTYTPAAGLLQAGNFYKFFAADPVTNEANGFPDLVIDTVENAPTALALASDSGVAGDNRTNDATPTITGKADKAPATLGAGESLPFNFQTTVKLYDTDGVTVIGSGTINPLTGDWSVTVSAALTEGAHQITARATDLADNVSALSAALAITIDTTAPAPPENLALHASTDSGAAGDNLTNFTRPRVTGTAEAGSSVQLYDGNTPLSPTAFADGSGNWSITLASALSDGPHNLTAWATDSANNTSSASSILTVTIDTTAPSLPASLALHPTTDSGAVGDNLTNFSRPRITGTAEAGSTVQLFDGAALSPTAVADGAGSWSITVTNALADGPHNLTARTTDAAGNTSLTSSALTVTIDTTVAPPTGLTLAPGSDDGASTNDNITSVRTPTVLGQAEPGSTVRVLINGALAGTVTVSGLGDWSFTSPFLADGVYNFTATAIDRAANTSLASTTLQVTVQQTPVPPPPPPPPAATPAPLPLPAAAPVTNVVVQQEGLPKKLRRRVRRRITLINAGSTTLTGPLFLFLSGLSRKIKVEGASGGGFLTVDTAGSFAPGAKLTLTLLLNNPKLRKVAYTPLVVTDASAL